MLPFPPHPTRNSRPSPSYHPPSPIPLPRRIFLTAQSQPTRRPPHPDHQTRPHRRAAPHQLAALHRAAHSTFYITTGRGARKLSVSYYYEQSRASNVPPSPSLPPPPPPLPVACASEPARRHGAPPRRPAPRPRRLPRVRARRRGHQGAQGRVLRAELPPRRDDRAARYGPRAGARGPQRRLRHAPPVPRLLRQRMRRVGADGRDAHDAGGEGGALQHQLPPLLRRRGQDQGVPGGAVPRRRLLRRHHHHGRPRRRLPDRGTQLGGEARARGQPDGEPGGLGQHHAQPTRHREHAHQPLRPLQSQRHRPRRAVRLALRRRGSLLLHHVPPLQPVGLRPSRPPHGPGLPPGARRALHPHRRPERHRRNGRHPRRLRQPVLQGPRPPPRLPQLRPDALLRQRRDPAAGDAVQRQPGRLLQGLHRGDDQAGRAPEPQEGGDTAQLPRRQRPAASGEAGRAVPGAGFLNLIYGRHVGVSR